MSLSQLLKVCRVLSPAADATRPRLVTVGFSHFCEKARWALELSPMRKQYYEEIHCPAMHLSATLDLAAAPRVATWDADSHFQTVLNLRHEPKIAGRKEKTSIPKLVLPQSFMQKHENIRMKSPLDGIMTGGAKSSAVVANGSSGILKMLSDIYPAEMGYLYPTGEIGAVVIELENKLDTELGPAATSWAFGNLLLSRADFAADKGATASSGSDKTNENTVNFFVSTNFRQKVPLVEKIIWKTLGKGTIIPLMCKANGVTAEATAAAELAIHKAFQDMDALMKRYNPREDNGLHILGTRHFTAADIAFASLAAPIVLPPQTDNLFISTSELQDLCEKPHTEGAARMLKLARDVRAQYRSARHVLSLYNHYRFLQTAPEIGRQLVTPHHK